LAEYGASRAVSEPRNDALLSAVELNVVAPHKLVNTQRGVMTLSKTTFRLMTLSIMKLSIITLSIMTFSIMTLSIVTLSIMTLGITKIISDTQQNYIQHYGMECHKC
jgi:hypothetical protein